MTYEAQNRVKISALVTTTKEQIEFGMHAHKIIDSKPVFKRKM